MDIFHTLDIYKQTYKFHNDTNYNLYETYLDSDTGFMLNYRKGRGASEFHWNKAIAEMKFGTATNMGKYLERETSIDQLDLRRLHYGKQYVLNFVFGQVWYGFAFDGKEYMMQYNDGNLYLPYLMFC